MGKWFTCQSNVILVAHSSNWQMNTFRCIFRVIRKILCPQEKWWHIRFMKRVFGFQCLMVYVICASITWNHGTWILNWTQKKTIWQRPVREIFIFIFIFFTGHVLRAIYWVTYIEWVRPIIIKDFLHRKFSEIGGPMENIGRKQKTI